jgi:hypothetical protein
VSVAVRIFCGQGEIPLLVDGTISEDTGNSLRLLCAASAADLKAGAKVVLTIDGSSEKRVGTITTLTESTDGGYEVGFEDTARHSADKRDFPRLHAGLPVQYMCASPPEAAAWIAGEQVSGSWHEPDPYMNFSVGGLRFDVSAPLDAGDLLLIALQIGDEQTQWRATGRVVRTFEETASKDAVGSVAVSFEHLPADALEALSRLTLQIQESLL